ncbi:hypothetical protein [Chryseobacterium sp. RU33C]|jgi:hypothetical protein|uniref:hypothetical protein n=1 Tax=Chryseobacterium sp. RU33C TaxID=1907398 RepID=UPI0009545A81|nr:hypothetical protein [Chryseobacterium sp. RU33C]SIR29867.1 hypothetical protein SAMN05880573_12036 [Chryseobacterium sp. RU33C]
MIRIRKCNLVKRLPLTILSFSLFSCQHESQFDLNKDLYHFSERMENGDTVRIMTDLSACMFFASETYTFTKQHDTLFLEKYSEITSYGKTTQTLPKIPYKVKASDPLSFENYLKFLNKEDKPHEKGDFPLVTVTYKKQNRKFYDDGLQDKFMKHDSLFAVKENIYPKDPFFKQEAPPPPTIIKNKKS